MYLRLVGGGESTAAFDVGATVAGWTTAPLPGTTASAESSASSEPSEPDFERDLDPAPEAAFSDLHAGALEE
jgi:hypothetical protein